MDLCLLPLRLVAVVAAFSLHAMDLALSVERRVEGGEEAVSYPRLPSREPRNSQRNAKFHPAYPVRDKVERGELSFPPFSLSLLPAIRVSSLLFDERRIKGEE